jgi:hypothetical protein
MQPWPWVQDDLRDQSDRPNQGPDLCWPCCESGVAFLPMVAATFLWSALIFVAGAVVAGLMLKQGGLAELASGDPTAKADLGSKEPDRIHKVRVRVSCR